MKHTSDKKSVSLKRLFVTKEKKEECAVRLECCLYILMHLSVLTNFILTTLVTHPVFLQAKNAPVTTRFRQCWYHFLQTVLIDSGLFD